MYNPLMSPQYLVFYDIPLFLLFFGLFFLVAKLIVRIEDPVINTAAGAFSAGLAYFIVRSQFVLYRWFLWNWKSVFGIIIVFIIFLLAFFTLKLGL